MTKDITILTDLLPPARRKGGRKPAQDDTTKVEIAFPLDHAQQVVAPDRLGEGSQGAYHPLVTAVRAIPSVEICWIDAHCRIANGPWLSDFFDFT
jgi:hypothetical protein